MGVLIAATVVLVAFALVHGLGHRTGSTTRSGDPWTDVHVTEHPLLRSDCRIALQTSGPVEPPAARSVLLVEGETVQVRQVSDLSRFVRELVSERDAIWYSRLLREFEISHEEVPGTFAWTRVRGGVVEDMEQRLRMAGCDAETTVRLENGEFVVRRPIVEFSSALQVDRAVIIEERISRDGSYSFRYGRELLRGEAVGALVEPAF